MLFLDNAIFKYWSYYRMLKIKFAVLVSSYVLMGGVTAIDNVIQELFKTVYGFTETSFNRKNYP